MAIIEAFPGISATICVDGKPLKEYIDDAIEDDEGESIRYIEAVSGKKFEVFLGVQKGTKITRSMVVCHISIDGNWVAGPVIDGKLFVNADLKRIIEGKEIEDGKVQNFEFVVLDTVSDGRLLNSEASNMKNLGTIVIEISFEDFKARTSAKPTTLKGLGFVSEKALKGEAITHGVDFGKAVKPKKAPGEVWEMCNCDEKNQFKIVFKYRSTDALKQMYIIPRTPSPEPIENRDPGTLTRDEIAKLQQFFKSQEAKKDAMVKIKRERKDDNPRSRKAARPSAGDTLLSIDDDNGVRELSTATLQQDEKEIIELD
ncbi:unnamed protein product [Zymoseptoria tritici ST99CH_3D7]|uniref:DUF7918 domain-containing protein n=2 Tax=Zymoseptoria tritici TaxID=1047171 RepID=A0A1X7S8C8_ZYMT9|nr:unnamed protein product [Zymoseptoria tritici ST99CH_3D7]SMR60861.1 unnamed protein product [Zymoseptoria tritici ST99CH_1E4]